MPRVKKLLKLAGILAVVAIVANIGTMRKLIRRQSRVHSQRVNYFGEPVPLDPVGSEDAKVRLTVFAGSANDCHAPTIEITTKLAKAVPERLRVEFLDTMTPEGQDAAQKAEINCDSGVLINGRKEFEVDHNGHSVTIGFHGPLGMETPIDQFRLVLQNELKTQYPEGLTDEETTALSAAFEALPDMGPEAEGQPGSEVEEDNANTAGTGGKGETEPEGARDTLAEKSPGEPAQPKEDAGGKAAPGEAAEADGPAPETPTSGPAD